MMDTIQVYARITDQFHTHDVHIDLSCITMEQGELPVIFTCRLSHRFTYN